MATIAKLKYNRGYYENHYLDGAHHRAFNFGVVGIAKQPDRGV